MEPKTAGAGGPSPAAAAAVSLSRAVRADAEMRERFHALAEVWGVSPAVVGRALRAPSNPFPPLPGVATGHKASLVRPTAGVTSSVCSHEYVQRM